jgi:hypothetical protein
MSHPTRQEGPRGPLIAAGLARRSALCNDSTTFTVYSRGNLQQDYVTRRSTRPGRRQKVQLLRLAHRSSPNLGAGLTARPDRDPGWSPWPTPHIQTRTIASTAPGRQALPGHLPAWGMAGPATCRANPSRPGPPPAFWRARSQHPAGPPQATRRRGRQPPTTLRAWRLASRALKTVGVAGWRRDDPRIAGRQYARQLRQSRPRFVPVAKPRVADTIHAGGQADSTRGHRGRA